MRNLEIQTLLRLHGLDAVVDSLKLLAKVDGDLVLFKYKQLEADWTIKALYDCRGLILNSADNWNIVSFPYEKFFNIGEGYCAVIDWETAKFYDKADGSLINFYFFNGKWNIQTSGTIHGESTANNNISTFADLVWKTVELMYGKDKFLSMLDTNKNYMFELCTPENIVVTPHQDYKILLHGIRDMRTLEFCNIDETDFVKAKRWDLANVDEMLAEFEDMDWRDEGFVVCDANYNRAKSKNPKYVAVHHVSTGVSPYAIMNVIKKNEIDEFCAYFKHREEEVMFLKEKWDEVHTDLVKFYNKIKNINTDKYFAITIRESELNRMYHGMMFALRNGKIESIHEGMCRIEHRYWFNLFHENK